MGYESALSLDEPPFRDVPHALRVGYTTEHRPFLKTPSWVPRKMGFNDLTPQERLAQARMVIGVVRRTLSPALLSVVEARYIPSLPGELRARKLSASLDLAMALQHANNRFPIAFLEDVVREWAGSQPSANLERWARVLGVTYQTLYFFRQGRRERRQSGIFSELDHWHGQALSALHTALSQQGIIANE